MKNKLFLLFALSFIILTMSGCNEMEEILGKVNQILDQQLEGDGEVEEEKESAEADSGDAVDSKETIPTSSEAEPTDANEGEGAESGHGADPVASFEERLEQAGYSKIDPPNGLSLPILQDWVLVEEKQADSNPWVGVFCFEAPMDETIAEVEKSIMEYELDTIMVEGMSIENGDDVHKTTFEYGDAYETWRGDIVYFADEFGTSCANVSMEFVE